MIKIKDYIFPEENILYIRQKTKDSVTVLRKRPNEYDCFRTELVIEATFDDIEWNYGENENNKFKEDNKELLETNMTLAINNKKLEEELEKEKKAWKDMLDSKEKLVNRIGKAIDYIEDKEINYATFNSKDLLDTGVGYDLWKILKGEKNDKNKRLYI